MVTPSTTPASCPTRSTPCSSSCVNCVRNVQQGTENLLGTGSSVPAGMNHEEAVTALMRAAYFRKR